MQQRTTSRSGIRGQPFDSQIVVDCFWLSSQSGKPKISSAVQVQPAFSRCLFILMQIVLPKNLSQKDGECGIIGPACHNKTKAERVVQINGKKPYEKWIYVSLTFERLHGLQRVSWVGACSISSHMQMTQLYSRSQIRCWVSTWL